MSIQLYLAEVQRHLDDAHEDAKTRAAELALTQDQIEGLTASNSSLQDQVQESRLHLQQKIDALEAEQASSAQHQAVIDKQTAEIEAQVQASSQSQQALHRQLQAASEQIAGDFFAAPQEHTVSY